MKRKVNKERDANAWMLTFSDLLTILLTFFVLLLSMSSLDNQKLKRTLSFFLSAAGAMEAGQKGGIGKVYIVPPKMAISGGRLDADSKGSGTEIKLGDHIGLKGHLNVYMIPLMNLANEAMGDIRPKEAEKKQLNLARILSFKGIDVDVRGKETILRVSSHLLFASGSAEIHIEGLELLLWLADSLRFSPHSIEVEGHTDNRPISTRRFPSNWELSLARSVNVVRFLEERGRIPGSRLSAGVYADLKPLFPNDTAEGRAKNRRVEIVLKEGQSP